MADRTRLLLGRVSDVGAPGRDASAILVEDGRIVAVGGSELAEAARADGAEVLDFGDAYLCPGFVDPHAHAELGAIALATMVDCRAPACRTVDDVLQKLRDNLDATDENGWLVGQANLFFDQKLADKRFPTRLELDAISRDVPIAIRAGGHTTILNTKAFELSDVTRYEGGTGMMGGAVIQRDSAGELTGLIAELDKALPLPSPDLPQVKEAIAEGMRELFTRYGVTTIGEISDTLDGLGCMDELIREDRLPLRFSVYLWAPGTMSLDEAAAWPEHLPLGAPRDRMDVRGIKLFADGGYSARNAATRTPYVEPHGHEHGWRGKINLDRAELAGALTKARAAGLQLAVHANGERAQEEVCAATVDAGPARAGDLPLRIEHGGNMVTDPATEEAWRSAGAVLIPQPVFIYNFGDFFPVYLGDGGARGRFPFRRLLDAGWRLSGSSDLHLGSEAQQTNPLFSVWCCLRRQSFLGEIIEPGQETTLAEALRMHTLDAAAALGCEHERGSLEVGKVADVAVLACDPADVGVDEIPAIRTDHVLLGGELVYSSPEARRPGGVAA